MCNNNYILPWTKS